MLEEIDVNTPEGCQGTAVRNKQAATHVPMSRGMHTRSIRCRCNVQEETTEEMSAGMQEKMTLKG